MLKYTRSLYSIISILFFLSGFASLIYQIAWQRLLSMHYGVGSISIALIVGIYMAGLGLGSLLGGYLAERLSKKITFYLWLEIAIGIFGLLSLPILNILGERTAGSPLVVSSIYMFLFLCFPTLLMGITLPFLTKIFNQYIKNFDKTVSYLYFINTIGAAIGALTASYLIISFWGIDIAVFVAVGIDFFLAFLVFLMGQVTRSIPAKMVEGESAKPSSSLVGKWAYLLVGITGFLAIGYEIVWYRFIGVLIKDSPYAFASILSVYLLGLAIGSLFMNRWLAFRPSLNKKKVYFFLQFLIGIFVLVSFIAFVYLTQETKFGKLTHLSFSIEAHPDPLMILNEKNKMGFTVPFMALFDVFFWPSFFLLIPTIFMGASFPLISSLALTRTDREGSTVGTIYFFTIMGNVSGSLLTSFLILPALGTERTLLVFAIINVLFLLFTVEKVQLFHVSLRAAAAGVIILLGIYWFPKPKELYFLIHPVSKHILFEEGIDSVVLTYHSIGQDRNFINGLEHGTTNNTIYNAWIVDTLSYSRALDDILIIGYGIGTFPEVTLKLPEAKNITVVELSPTLMTNMHKLERHRQVTGDPRVKLVIDDGRRYLLANHQQYDAIIMDPVRSTTAYSNNLHSLEFMHLVRSRLKPEGVVFLGGMKEGKILPKTFATAFPYSRVYYYCAIGSNSPLVDAEHRREFLLSQLPDDQNHRVRGYLKSTYRGDRQQTLKHAGNSPINRIYKPRTEYYLGYQLREYFGWE